MSPEVVSRILDELDEGDQQTPRMRPVHDQSFEEHARDLLLNDSELGFGEQVQDHAREVVRVAVRIAKLVCDRVDEGNDPPCQTLE